MTEYNKIETLFKRDMEGTRKIIEGDFRNEAVKYLAFLDWEFTEKIDGTNIRVFWNGHKISFNGRTDKANLPSKLKSYLEATFLTNEMEEMFEQLWGSNEVILFGEGYGAGIQTGGNYRNDMSFIMFDVMVNGKYIDKESARKVAEGLGIDFVPTIINGTIEQAIDFVKHNPPSTIGTANMEGLVGTPKVDLYGKYGERIIVKIKYVDFKGE